MVRWERGADQIEAMLERDELQHVAGGSDAAYSLLGMADRHVDAAKACVHIDAAGAYALAYDATRKAGTALLAHQGLRPTTRGGHIAVVEATEAQVPNVPGLRSLDRLRRRRNQAEYPDPTGYDPITIDEAQEAITVASQAVDTTRRIIDRPEIGMFR
ncbi:MAG TPA: hypothetical protein VFI46_07440 [Jiangellaceae bacterium]|nr:hypothetical protein [Jiangellaceae bacterium]